MEQGILIVVSGFSGSGKGTLMQKLLQEYPGYSLSVSATTRAPREHEIDGKHYYFLTEEEFRAMIERDELYEYARFQDHYYGTPREYVERMRSAGQDVILEIDVQGAENIKKRFPDTVLIFVVPPSAEELRSRLEKRGTESAEKIRGRLLRARAEAEYMDRYDYILVNDDLDACVRTLHGIIRSEHARTERNSALIERIRQELQAI